MQAAPVRELKVALQQLSEKELIALCVRLASFKKENKELLTYLLFEADDEHAYIRSIKGVMDEEFSQVNRRSYYRMKKSVRRIQRQVNRYCRYSRNKATEVELLLYFCHKIKTMSPSVLRYRGMTNLYLRQIEAIRKKLTKLDEDLQYDFGQELEALLG